MTKQPHDAGPSTTGPAGGSRKRGEPAEKSAPPQQGDSAPGAEARGDTPGTGSSIESDRVRGRDKAPGRDAEVLDVEVVAETVLEGEIVEPGSAGGDADGSPATPDAAGGEMAAGGKATAGETRPGAAGEAGAGTGAEAEAESTVEVAAELGTLRQQVEERTSDLLRVTAEYANYRKRVDRDRALAAEQATANVLFSLLPVLDDLDRARDHGDLVGPFGSVAEQLIAVLGKYSLSVFGAKGDVFDPKVHEAVAHMTSTDVTEPTCVDVLRRGYKIGDRLLRPAMVAVADPG